MPSETDCLNDALGQIGASRIGSIGDGSVNANHCLTFYPTLRDGLIRSFKWNFSLVRAALAQDATAPAFGFAYSYTLPSDPWCLRVWEYVGANPSSGTVLPVEAGLVAKYKVEGRKILSNDGQVSIQYGARITNPDLWDAMFYQMVTTWLASKLANAIPKDGQKSRELLGQVNEILLPLALAADGQEGSVEAFVVDNLIFGRNSA